MRPYKLICLLFTITFFGVSKSPAEDFQVNTAGGTVTWTHYNTYISEVYLSRGTSSHGDGYDGAMNVQVSGPVQYDVSLHFSSTYAVAIEYVTVVNSSASAQTYSITCSGNLGSDGSTAWHYASENGPFYTISSDRSSPSEDGSDPVVSFLYGDSSLVELGTQPSMPYTNGSDNHSFSVSNVTIPAGTTHAYLFLAGAGDIDDTIYNRPSQARTAVQQLLDFGSWPADFTSFMSNGQLEQIVNWGVTVEPLNIEPDSETVFVGYQDGPLQASNQVYTVQNRSDGDLSWSVSSSEDWLSVLPESGELELDEVQEVTATVNEPENGFSVGDHAASLTFTNITSNEIYVRDVVVSVFTPPTPPATPEEPSPADGAGNVSAGTLLEWVHDSGTVLPPPLVNTNSTYTVYFGTNINAMTVAASGLTNTTFDPGLLDVDTTYYWQVAATNAVGVSTGGVWNFTTWVSGPMDHFEVDLLSDHPRMEQPFEVAVTARDSHGNTVVDYTGSATIEGFRNTTNSTILLNETFEGADVDDWNLNSGAYVANDSSFSGDECLFLSTNSTSAQFNHEAMQPGKIQFAVRSDIASSYSYTIFSDDSYNYLCYYYMSEGSMFLYTGGSIETIPIEAGRWYQVSIFIDWEEQQLEWYLDGTLVGSDLPFSDADAENVERIEIYSSSGNQVRYDEFQYQDVEVIPEAVPITPASTSAFDAGIWTGQVQIAEQIASAFLTVSDSLGHAGRSDNFTVDYRGDLTLQFPEDLTEGQGLRSGAAQVMVSVPPSSNLVVSLSVAPGAELVLPDTVEIPAGQTNATFDVTVLDDALLDGSQTSWATIELNDYRGSTTPVVVHDNETAALSLALPASTTEGMGFVSGVLEVDRAPEVDVRVELWSDQPAKVQSGSVVIPAGETYVPFSLLVLNDYLNDGIQTATITAHVQNWIDSQATMFVLEGDQRVLSVQVNPAQVAEDAGLMSYSAYVGLAGAATHDLAIRLRSSDPSELSVPDWITIRAGSSGTYFDYEIHDDFETDGAQMISITAEAPGYVLGANTVTVVDNELHHFAVGGLSTDIPLLKRKSISVTARTIDDYPTDKFNGTVALSAAGDRGPIEIEPQAVTNMVNGSGSETLVFHDIGNDVRLFMDGGGGILGTSSVFNVVAPQIVVSADPLTNMLVIAGESAAASMSIANTGNSDLEFKLADASLVAYYPLDGEASDLSGNGLDGSVYGAEPVADRFGDPEHAYRFNGSSSYIDAGSMGDFKTVSMWVKPENLHRADYYFGHHDFRLYTSVENNNRLVLADSETTIVTSAQMANYLDQWVHIAAISDGANSKVYLNGSLVGTGTLGAVSNQVVNLGRWPQDLHYFNGSLDEVRVYDRVLSQEEIRTQYKERWLEVGLAANYPLDGSVNDVSGNGQNGTAYSAVPTTDRFGDASSAYRLNGSGSYLEFPSGIVSDMTECSLSLWVNLSTLATWSRIFDFGTGEQVYMFLTPRSNANTLRFATTISGNGSEYQINAPLPAQNRWVHIVVTLGGGSGSIYVNGSMAGNTLNMMLTPADMGITTRNWIGRSQYSGDPYVNGSIDDFRIYSRKLTGSEVRTLYSGAATQTVQDWLTLVPASGTIPPGGSTNAIVAFDAANRVAGDYLQRTLRIASNDAVTPKVERPASMWVLPTAPAMDDEPAYTAGFSNTVSWSAQDGPVEYEVVMTEATNTAPLETASSLSETSHTFGGLATNSIYFYRARASITNGTSQLAGPWSSWVWSTQAGDINDLDGDTLPDWWETMYLGGMAYGDPQGDPDGDGLCNLDEYFAGMNPTDAAECFMLEPSAPPSNGMFVVTWNSVTGRLYSVYWSPSLESAFQPLETNIAYPRNSYTDAVHHAESEGFYSVEVELNGN